MTNEMGRLFKDIVSADEVIKRRLLLEGNLTGLLQLKMS
jgi:hypothetical protein